MRSLVNRHNTREAGTWKDVARAAGYTPVFADWCFHYALDADGVPIVSVDGTWRDGRVVRNPIWRNKILAQASAPQASEEKRLADAAARALGFTLVSSDFCTDYALDAEGNPVEAMWGDWRNSEPVHDPVVRDEILALAKTQGVIR
ncbi:MAG TPA: hypothetical protein VNW46_08715 [Gemmatimonadaceae bacterium]|nr:hypothetical protein [Gemmatimonadaceae bacterium]